MKLIQLGDASGAPCHFLSLGGFEMLLDCGARGVRASDADGSLELLAPALDAVDVEALDLVLLSSARAMQALPLLTERLGFRGQILATRMALEVGRLVLEELAQEASRDGRKGDAVFGTAPDCHRTSMYSLDGVRACCDKVRCVEFGEVVALPYGLRVTALSSGLSLGASMWVIESPAEKLAYVGAASGDYTRHPKELDLLPLIDCESLLLTDLKPDRDPHANTERMLEGVLASVTRVLDRGGVCLIPTAPDGMLLDLIEAIYASVLTAYAQQQQPQQIPIYFLSSHAAKALELTQCAGAEWLCQKKIEQLYAGEPAFVHEGLRKSGIIRILDDLSSAAPAFQTRGIIFLGHPSLQFGFTPQVIRTLGNDARNAVLLIDPSVDAAQAFSPFQDLQIEKIVCPIDPRLSCGDANQLIARCSPRNLLVPLDFTVAPPVGDSTNVPLSSHFAQVLPLSELTVAKSKAELLTVAFKPLEAVIIEKPSKYVDGKLDPKVARRATLTEVGGKAAAMVTGALELKRNTFVLNALPSSRPFIASAAIGDGISGATPEGKGKATGKRKLAAMSSSSAEGAGIAGIDQSEMDFYRDNPALLLGQVDEEKLADQIRAHDPQAQVYISQGQGDADVFMSIPSLNARVTLWKQTSKTLVETESEDARALLTSLLLSQLVVVK